MIDNLSKGPRPQEGGKHLQKNEKPANDRELQKLRVETSGTHEVVEGIVGGEIAEDMSEDKSGLGDYSTGQSAGDAKAQIQDIKAHLLEKMPKQRTMISEVKKKLVEERVNLRKEAKKAEQQRDYYALNKMMSRMREIYETLAELKNASMDYLKKCGSK